MVSKNGADLQSSKEQITKDALLIITEIAETDLNISSNSIEEAHYYEKYSDPDFQGLILSLKRMCKRERMLVTILNKHIKDMEEEKESAELALAD